MHLLGAILPIERKQVDYLSPVLSIEIARDRASVLRFEQLHDDLDELEAAYLEADGIPVVFQRRPIEPEGVYTLYVDADGVMNRWSDPRAFTETLLADLGIRGRALWVNDDMPSLSPRDAAESSASPSSVRQAKQARST